MKKTLLLGTSLLASSFLFAACDGDTSNPESTAFTGAEVSHQNAPLLENGFHYEGWVMVDGMPVTFGKFNIDPDGAIVDLEGNALDVVSGGTEFEDASDVVITIEPDGDTDDIPSGTKVFAGSVDGDSATVNAQGMQALGDDFSASTGEFILATPTDNDAENEKSGVWFLNPDAGPGPGLSLPTLPAGWEYEGWVVSEGTPISTGRFTEVMGADDFAGFSGTDNPAPPFPGEDFLNSAPAGANFPADIAMVVISIEPSPDDSPAPFQFKPLVRPIETDAPEHMLLSMENDAAAFATMSIKLVP